MLYNHELNERLTKVAGELLLIDGEEYCLNEVVEDLASLIISIHRYARGKDSKEDLACQIAEVILALHKLKVIRTLGENNINYFLTHKLLRTEDRIELMKADNYNISTAFKRLLSYKNEGE